MSWICLAAVCLFLFPGLLVARDEKRSTNVIFILVDDQGYYDLGCYGATEVKTSRIDQLALEGIRFTDYYAAAPICSPSRAGILTGCYPRRVGNHIWVHRPDSKFGIHPDELTIAELFKANGYATACIGKWHLGFHRPFLPRQQGFDHYFGMLHNFPEQAYLEDERGMPLLRNDEIVKRPVEPSELSRLYTDETVDFITRNKDESFFVYLPHTMLHSPLGVSEEFRGSSDWGMYGDAIQELDHEVGRIMDALMEPDEVTIAESLGNAGYATGIFGKWHLGDYYPTRPMDQGFQESLVHQGGGLRQPSNPPDGERYHDPILFHNGRPKRYEGYCTEIFFDEAIRFIEQQTEKKKPFFAYIPTNAPHGPFDEPPTRELLEHFQAKFPEDRNQNRAAFYAMVKNVDDNIGRLLARLSDLDIERDTLVIFLTDNGPSAGSAGPFRSNKGAVYEGGIRTVCFLRWPGVIEPGSSSDVTTAHIDLMPTILDLCNVPSPSKVKLDGRSLRPLLSMPGAGDKQDWPDRHLFLQWHRGDVPQRYHQFAVVGPQGRWKLLNDSSSRQHSLDGPPNFELYDLHNDIGETKNIAKEHVEIVARLKRAYDELFDDVCSTRKPNFGMPPIVIGSDKQRTVILTPQDRRLEDGGGSGGFWAAGYWPVDIRSDGPYTVKVLLNQQTPEETTVELSVVVGEKQLRKQLTVPRGVDSTAIGNVILPSGGIGRIVARVEGADRRGPKVYQVTIK